jgi:WD40 repeat protein
VHVLVEHGLKTTGKSVFQYPSPVRFAAITSPDDGDDVWRVEQRSDAESDVRTEWRGPGDALCFNPDCTLFADKDSPTGDLLVVRVPKNGLAPEAPMLRLPARMTDLRAAFSPDNRLIAASGNDGHVRLWTLDGKLTLDIPTGPAFAFLPDGRQIATGTVGGPLALTDLKTLRLVRQIDFRCGYELAFSADGGRIVTWNGFAKPVRDVTMMDLATGQTGTIPHPEAMVAVAWHPSGRQIAIGTLDARILRWNVTDIGHPVALPTLSIEQTRSVGSLVYSHRGDLLASPGSDHSLRLWDAVSGEPLVDFSGSAMATFGSDDRTLAIGSYAQGKHGVLDLANGSERRTFAPPPNFDARDVALSPDGSMMACGGDAMVRVWNLTQPFAAFLPIDLPLPDERALEVRFLPDGGGLLIRSDKSLWRTSIRKHEGDIGAGGVVRRLTIDSPLTRVRTWDQPADGRMQVAADGRHVAIAHRGQPPCVIDLNDPNHPFTLEAAPRTTLRLSISPDARWVATGKWSAPGGPYVSVWDAATGVLVKDLPIDFEAAVAFSPDGKWLVTCSNVEYRVWEVGTWKELRTMPRNVDWTAPIPISGDSLTMAITPQAGGVELVDPGTGDDLVTLDDLDREIPLELSRDGAQLVTICHDGTLRLWDLRRIRAELAGMGLDWPGPATPPPVNNRQIELTIEVASRGTLR